jgi:catechol-2,3-dioxygenase
MDITHLHLHVTDRPRAADFYRRWFGLEVKRDRDDITFMTGADDFLLALQQDAASVTMPDWFHFGIRMPSADALTGLLSRMEAARIGIAKPLYKDAAFASFRCRDPDGYVIEVYWEE